MKNYKNYDAGIASIGPSRAGLTPVKRRRGGAAFGGQECPRYAAESRKGAAAWLGLLLVSTGSLSAGQIASETYATILAYIDPGIGALVLQAITVAFLSVVFFFRQTLWNFRTHFKRPWGRNRRKNVSHSSHSPAARKRSRTALPSHATGYLAWVAQATGLSRRATRPTERAARPIRRNI